MAFTYGFYNSYEGDRKYNAEEVSSLFDGLITDGIYATIGDAFAVSVLGDRSDTLVVGTGRAWFNQTWSANDTDYYITILEPEINHPRIDALVLEIDKTIYNRKNSIKIVKGTGATNPSKPKLINSDNVYQYPLAYITVPANSDTVTMGNIENARGTSACPFVAAILKTINIDTLIGQWQYEWYEKKEEWDDKFEDTKKDFEDWFHNLNDFINDNVELKLIQEIENLKEKISDLSKEILSSSDDYLPIGKYLKDFILNAYKDKVEITDININVNLSSTTYFPELADDLTYSAISYDSVLQDDSGLYFIMKRYYTKPHHSNAYAWVGTFTNQIKFYVVHVSYDGVINIVTDLPDFINNDTGITLDVRSFIDLESFNYTAFIHALKKENVSDNHLKWLIKNDYCINDSTSHSYQLLLMSIFLEKTSDGVYSIQYISHKDDKFSGDSRYVAIVAKNVDYTVLPSNIDGKWYFYSNLNIIQNSNLNTNYGSGYPVIIEFNSCVDENGVISINVLNKKNETGTKPTEQFSRLTSTNIIDDNRDYIFCRSLCRGASATANTSPADRIVNMTEAAVYSLYDKDKKDTFSSENVAIMNRYSLEKVEASEVSDQIKNKPLFYDLSNKYPGSIYTWSDNKTIEHHNFKGYCTQIQSSTYRSPNDVCLFFKNGLDNSDYNFEETLINDDYINIIYGDANSLSYSEDNFSLNDYIDVSEENKAYYLNDFINKSQNLILKNKKDLAYNNPNNLNYTSNTIENDKFVISVRTDFMSCLTYNDLSGLMLKDGKYKLSNYNYMFTYLPMLWGCVIDSSKINAPSTGNYPFFKSDGSWIQMSSDSKYTYSIYPKYYMGYDTTHQRNIQSYLILRLRNIKLPEFENGDDQL